MTIIHNLFNKKFDNKNKTLKIKFLFGLIYYKKNMEDYSSELRLLGISIVHSNTISLITKYFIEFPRIPLFKKNITSNVVKELEEYIPNNKDAFFFGSRSGEFFLLMYHFKGLLKKYNTNFNKVIILTPYKYHLSIFSLFYPNLQIIKLPIKYAQINRNITSNIFNLNNGKRVIIPLLFSHYLQVEDKVRKKENIHFYQYLKTNHNLTSDDLTIPKVNSEIMSQVDSKIKRMNLNEDNFVIISLGSVSNKPMSNDFWISLSKKILNNGLDIYFNSLANNEITQYGKTCYMTHAEMFYFVQKAKAVIGLRSGFLDTIVSNSNKTIALYTDFNDRPILGEMASDDVLRGFSLKKLPQVNPANIWEFDVNKFSEDDLITNIMEVS